jgi:hypothetical protein
MTASTPIVRMEGHEGSSPKFNNERDFFVEEDSTISLLILAGMFSGRARLRLRFGTKYAAHLSTQLSGNSARVNSVSNDLRPDKDDELGPSHGPG